MAAPAKSILDMGSNKIIALLDGTANTDAINLGQLNSSQDAQPFKKKVRAATTANITLSGTQTVDGVGLVANDRCLVKNQTTASQNGIYVVSAGAWNRATDSDATADFSDGQIIPVAEGTTNADSVWVLTTDGAITVGTTSLTYKRLSRANQATAGTYGSATQVPVAVLNDDGTVSSFTNTDIALTSTGITGLSSGQLLYGNGSGNIGQTANLNWSGLQLQVTGSLRVTAGSGTPDQIIGRNSANGDLNNITLGTALSLVSGALTLDSDLVAVAGLSTNGISVRTGTGTWSIRSLAGVDDVSSFAGVTWTNPDGVSGDPSLSINTNLSTIKAVVRVATTANITLSGTQTIDGVAVVAGDRVLVKNQTTASGNGIYIVAAGAWSRAIDFDSSTKADNGLLVYVRSGTANGGEYWKMDTVAPITLGTTSLAFSQTLTAGGGTPAGANYQLQYYNTGAFGADANIVVTPGANPRMAVGTSSPSYTMDLVATDAIRIPVGTSAQQPTAAAGLLRLNSTNPSLDYHDGTAWRTVITTAVAAVGQGAGNNQITYFSTPGNITSNANGGFDGTNMGLGVGSTANQRLTIVGAGSTSGTYALRVHNSSGSNNQLVVRNDGRVGILTSAPLFPLHVSGDSAVGDQVTATNSTRALNLVASNAVMRILRVSAVSSTAAPAIELIHRTSADGANTVFYDIFGDSTGMSFRDRQNLSDVKVLQIGTNGNATNRCVDAATAALVTTQTYSLNSSGTANTNFGHRMIWQLESSTTNDQDAAYIDTFWTTATHGSRTAAAAWSAVVSGTMTEHLRIGGKVTKVTGQFTSTQFALTDGATINTDWNNGNTQTVTLAGNRTMATPTNPQTGATYTYIIKQDATGSRTLTWFTIRWAGGNAPTLTTTANKWDIITLKYDGANYFGTAALNF